MALDEWECSTLNPTCPSSIICARAVRIARRRLIRRINWTMLVIVFSDRNRGALRL